MTRRAQALRDVTINGCDVYQIVGNSEVLFAMIDADVTIALLVRRINSNNNVYDKMERRRSSSCKMSLCKSASSFLGYEDSSVDADCGSGWKYAPQVVLVKIYFFLNDTDRAVMARVCRNWSLAFEAGCLWRRRRFEMGGYRARTAEFQASGFAEKFGQHLRYLTISCNHPSLVTCKIFQRAMEAFLPKLQRKAKLKEFRFSRLEMDRYWRYEQLKEKLILTLTRFLRQQFCLRVLDLSYSQFYLSAGLRIIESVGLSCGHCLRRLMMEDIFHSRLTVYSGLRYKRAMSRFTNLRTLSLNYGYLSDDVMEILRGNLAGKLKTMRVRVYRSDPHGHRITKLAWNGLRRACPSLKVKFNFESIGFASDIIPILVAGIPLYELYIWTGFDDNSDWRLSSTLNHVAANFKDSLEICNFEFDNSTEMIDDALFRLTQSCVRLRSFITNAVLLISTIQNICELVEQRKLDPRTFHITACNLSDLEWAELAYLQEKYANMADERSIDFRLSSDLIVESRHAEF